jgi:hypothetical protein
MVSVQYTQPLFICRLRFEEFYVETVSNTRESSIHLAISSLKQWKETKQKIKIKKPKIPPLIWKLHHEL